MLAVSDAGSGPPSLEEEQKRRPKEELMMLMVGATLGFLIGGFFITYIVLAIASGEATQFAPPH